MARFVIVEGTSEPYDFQLYNNGVALVGTGLDVELELFRGASQLTGSPPQVAWLDQTAGTVRVTGLDSLSKGNYRARYKLTDAGTLIGYAPNQDAADEWAVVRV
jgi:hypothetical protein